jgi:hypothetical protein
MRTGFAEGSRLLTRFPGRPANLGRHAFRYQSERQIRDPFFIHFSDFFGQCVGLLSVFLLGLSLVATNDANEIVRPLLTWRHSAADVAHRAAPSKLAKSQRSAPNSEIPSRGPKNKNNPAVQAWINQQTLMAVHY